MNDLDLNSRLLLGKSIKFKGIKLTPLKINEILDDEEEIGFDLYNKYLGILCMDSDSIKEMLNIENEDTIIDPFEYLCVGCYHDEESKKIILNSFNLFLREQVFFNVNGFFYTENDQVCNIINQNNFNDFIKLLKQQNCISLEKSKKIKPQNDKQKEFFAQLKKMREKYAKHTNKNEQDISDIMSAVSSKHPSINSLNIGELNVYALVDQYKRLNMIDSYFLSYKSLLAGSDPKEVKIVHWGSRISQSQ